MVTEPVNRDEIDKAFDMIKPFLLDIAEHYHGEPLDEIYQMLITRSATLHFVGNYGFAICQWLPGECFIHTSGSFFHDGCRVNECLNAIVAYAKSYGCQSISFSSNRKGWLKVAPKSGFVVDLITYKKEL